MFARHNCWHLITRLIPNSTSPLSWAGTVALKGKGTEERKEEKSTLLSENTRESLLHRGNTSTTGDVPYSWIRIHY